MHVSKPHFHGLQLKSFAFSSWLLYLGRNVRLSLNFRKILKNPTIWAIKHYKKVYLTGRFFSLAVLFVQCYLYLTNYFIISHCFILLKCELQKLNTPHKPTQMESRTDSRRTPFKSCKVILETCKSLLIYDLYKYPFIHLVVN